MRYTKRVPSGFMQGYHKKEKDREKKGREGERNERGLTPLTCEIHSKSSSGSMSGSHRVSHIPNNCSSGVPPATKSTGLLIHPGVHEDELRCPK